MDKNVFPLQFAKFYSNIVEYFPKDTTPMSLFLLGQYVIRISSTDIRLRYVTLKD